MVRRGSVVVLVAVLAACKPRSAPTPAATPAPSAVAPLAASASAPTSTAPAPSASTPPPDESKTPAAVLAAAKAAVERAAAIDQRVDDARRRPLEAALRKLIAIVVKADVAADRSAAGLIAGDLRHVLADAGVVVHEPGTGSSGDDLEVSARSLDDRHLAVAIEIPFLGTWSDSALYVFEHGPAGVRLKLALESKGAAAFVGLSYATSSHFASDDVVIAAWGAERYGEFHHGSWWAHYGSLHVRAVRAGKSPDSPERLFDDERMMAVDGERPTWTTGGDVVTLRFMGNLVGLASLQSREHVFAFRCSARGVERVPPWVAAPVDLPDEWLRAPWSTAREWTAPKARDQLRAWHEKLRAARPSLKEKTFGSVGSPSDGTVVEEAPDRFRVELECTTPRCKRARIPSALDVIVARVDGALRIADIRTGKSN